MWPKGSEHERPLGIGLDYLSHFALLWRYRNSLIHEFRPAGGGFDIGESAEPYYHQVSEILSVQPADEREYRELIYPVSFLDQLCRRSLDNRASYLLRNGLNPFDCSDTMLNSYAVKESDGTTTRRRPTSLIEGSLRCDAAQ